MSPAISLRGAVALAGGFPVLAGVDLDVEAGEIVLLQGANGAGKTSVLRVCAGLLAVTRGRAEVLGCDLVADPRAVRRRVGLLGHASALYDDLRVRENVAFAVRAARGRGDGVEGALTLLGLTGRLADAPVAGLSAGQRRRVALAVLVARRPEVWLLDEPHAGLDAEHRDLLDGLVRSVAAGGATVVLASHERDRAHALAGRVVEVAGGVVVPSPVDPDRAGAEAEVVAAGEAVAAGGAGAGAAAAIGAPAGGRRSGAGAPSPASASPEAAGVA